MLTEEYKILNSVAKHALNYLDELPGRPVFPDNDSLQKLEQFSIPLPEQAAKANEVIDTIKRNRFGEYSGNQWWSLFWICIWRNASCFVGGKLAGGCMGSKCRF